MTSEVRAGGRDALSKAWDGFKREYECMLQVWNDLDLALSAAAKQPGGGASDKQEDSSRRRLREEVASLLRQAAQDPFGAVRGLGPILEGPCSEEMNKACSDKAREVQHVLRHAQLCDRLAQACQASASVVATGGRPATPAPEELKELDQLLKGCKLTSQLGIRTRRVLGMPPSKEELAEQERARRAAEEKAYRAKVKQVAEASGAPRARAQQALDSTNGDADTATVILLSEEEANSQRKAEVAARKRREAKDAAQALHFGRTVEAAAVASEMTELAQSTQNLAWLRVREEFGMQVTVWESQANLGKNRSFGRIVQEMQGVLDNALGDPAGSVTLLEMVLQKASAAGHTLSNGVIISADAVVDAERLSCDRFELAERLRSLARHMEGKTGLQPASSFGKQALTRLVQACDLDDHSLGPRVHEVLRAGVPAMRHESI